MLQPSKQILKRRRDDENKYPLKLKTRATYLFSFFSRHDEPKANGKINTLKISQNLRLQLLSKRSTEFTLKKYAD